MAVMTASSSTATAREQYRLGSVTSKDGTTIGYRQIGHGPGVVLVHGAMESALSHSQLAEALADTFTVCVYDRRGRGRSGPFVFGGCGHWVQLEKADEFNRLAIGFLEGDGP